MAELAKALMSSFEDGREDDCRIEALTQEIIDLLKKPEKRLQRLSAGGPSEDSNVKKYVQRTRSEYLTLYTKLNGKPVIPAGLLPPEKPKEQQIEDDSWIETIKWLDQQEPKSIVFVGFGSECKQSREQVFEIAYGLEESEVPFLWVLRKPNWANDDVDALPPGFFERNFDHKQKVCIGWARQMMILAHPSIAGWLFHAGWGSAIEALQFGHCLVVLPFVVDQGLNARFFVEKGLAIEVERGEDGSFRRSDIAKALRQTMVGKEGEGMRARSRGMAAVVGNRELHDGYIAKFVEYLKNGVGKQK